MEINITLSQVIGAIGFKLCDDRYLTIIIDFTPESKPKCPFLLVPAFSPGITIHAVVAIL